MTDQLQMTPAEASAKLDTLKADKDWGAALMNGSVPHRDEYRKLSEIAATTDDSRINLAMAGEFLPTGFNDSEHLANMTLAAGLKDAGISETVIRQAITGQPVTRAEHDAAARRKAELMRDQDWTKRMMAKDGAPYAEFQLLSIVLNSPIKDSAA